MRGTAGSMEAQLGAEEVHMVTLGRAHSGSSRVPTRIKITPGKAADVATMCVPHLAQNLLATTDPLSASRRCSLVSPDTETAEALKIAFTVPPPPPMYWHTRHQQATTVRGCSVAL